MMTEDEIRDLLTDEEMLPEPLSKEESDAIDEYFRENEVLEKLGYKPEFIEAVQDGKRFS